MEAALPIMMAIVQRCRRKRWDLGSRLPSDSLESGADLPEEHCGENVTEPTNNQPFALTFRATLNPKIASQLIQYMVMEWIGPKVSKATGWKRYPRTTRSWYFRIFSASASSTAWPPVAAVRTMWLGAKGSTMFASQVSVRPRVQGTRVTPSTRFPSPLHRPGGSSIEGTPQLASARRTMSFNMVWRGIVGRHSECRRVREVRPEGLPYRTGNSCGARLPLIHPRRVATEIRNCEFVSFKPRELAGMASSQQTGTGPSREFSRATPVGEDDSRKADCRPGSGWLRTGST